ncbi:MAG: phasin family protein [Pseudomonadota bacterium]
MTTKTDKKVENKIEAAIKAEDVAATANKFADSAREFVKRSAATAKERSANMYDGANQLNSGLENTLTKAVTGYVGILGNIVEATHANVDHALSTAEKLAGAKSLSEAAQIQADYVRESTNANIERVRSAVETSRDVATEGFTVVRENVSKAWPYGKQAA